jgi:hypothetical protein
MLDILLALVWAVAVAFPFLVLVLLATAVVSGPGW